MLQRSFFFTPPVDTRWLALVVLCIGVLMIVLDTTIVNVALPSIREDLKFTGTSLVWVVNAYMVPFGSGLLLGGRLGDLYGRRRLFLAGIALFTIASLVGGLAATRSTLIWARAAQGCGGAVVLSVALSQIVSMFESAERARAISIYSFVCASGGSVGLLLGGSLTSALSWHWTLLVNVPVGIFVCAFILFWLPRRTAQGVAGRLDLPGALTITAALVLVNYTVVTTDHVGWMSGRTLALLGGAVILLATFCFIETHASKPLIPLRIFRMRGLLISNIVAMLWAAGASAWFFTAALYMQLVLGYKPMQVGIAFLPVNILVGLCSLGVGGRLVTRVGICAPLATGLLLCTMSLALFARAPLEARAVVDLLPGMILLGLGTGIAFNPLLLAATGEVAPSDAGLASGMINTARVVGGTLGLAILASCAAARTHALLASGSAEVVALASGYRIAFLLGALCEGAAALLVLLFLQRIGAVSVPVGSAPMPASTKS